jgi:hypothetical protein
MNIMKKAISIIILFMTSVCIIGCANKNAQTATEPEMVNALRSTVTLEECAAPVRYETEQAFVNAVKTKDENGVFNIKEITYYYRPKTVPEDAILKYVEILDTYVMLVYTLDKNVDSTNTTKIMNFIWYRSFDGGRTHPDAQSFIKGMTKNYNYGIVNIAGQDDGTTYMAKKSYKEAKLSGNLTDNPTWYLFWVQDGECFSGNIPYSIPEADIAKYLEMEKVTIQ